MWPFTPRERRQVCEGGGSSDGGGYGDGGGYSAEQGGGYSGTTGAGATDVSGGSGIGSTGGGWGGGIGPDGSVTAGAGYTDAVTGNSYAPGDTPGTAVSGPAAQPDTSGTTPAAEPAAEPAAAPTPDPSLPAANYDVQAPADTGVPADVQPTGSGTQPNTDVTSTDAFNQEVADIGIGGFTQPGAPFDTAVQREGALAPPAGFETPGYSYSGTVGTAPTTTSQPSFSDIIGQLNTSGTPSMSFTPDFGTATAPTSEDDQRSATTDEMGNVVGAPNPVGAMGTGNLAQAPGPLGGPQLSISRSSTVPDATLLDAYRSLDTPTTPSTPGTPGPAAPAAGPATPSTPNTPSVDISPNSGYTDAERTASQPSTAPYPTVGDEFNPATSAARLGLDIFSAIAGGVPGAFINQNLPGVIGGMQVPFLSDLAGTVSQVRGVGSLLGLPTGDEGGRSPHPSVRGQPGPFGLIGALLHGRNPRDDRTLVPQVGVARRPTTLEFLLGRDSREPVGYVPTLEETLDMVRKNSTLQDMSITDPNQAGDNRIVGDLLSAIGLEPPAGGGDTTSPPPPPPPPAGPTSPPPPPGAPSTVPSWVDYFSGEASDLTPFIFGQRTAFDPRRYNPGGLRR